jgi:hypothetical protein
MTGSQLYLRALRILTDGLNHSASAIEWAQKMTGLPLMNRGAADLLSDGFSEREISLGAQKEWA